MTKNSVSARMFQIKSLPTIKLFMDGVETAEYAGQRTAAAMFDWLGQMHNKQPEPQHLTTKSDSENTNFSRKVMTAEGAEVTKIDIGALKAAQVASASGSKSAAEIAKASKSEQTASKSKKIQGQTQMRLTKYGKWPTGVRPYFAPFVIDELSIDSLQILSGYTLEEYVKSQNPLCLYCEVYTDTAFEIV